MKYLIEYVLLMTVFVLGAATSAVTLNKELSIPFILTTAGLFAIVQVVRYIHSKGN